MVDQIDPIYERCGLCCLTAFMAMHNNPIGQDEKELARWLKLHRCEPMRYPTSKGDVLAVKIPLVCEWLDFDSEQGKYFCKDYENRPVICKEYFCKRCNSGENKQLVNMGSSS